MPDIITNNDINWVNNFPRISDALLASFWVKMVLDRDLNSHLDSEQIIYNRHAANHCPFEFWENTQFLIRSVCGERESLMGELYNKLNRKLSLHFDCYKSDRYKQELYYIKGDRLFLKIGFPIVFDDSKIYSKCPESSGLFLNKYVSNGYANAESIIEDINITDISNAINDAIQSIWRELNSQIDEDENSVKHLLKVALSYCYPTEKYNEKVFSALVDGQFIMQNQNKELSCKGAFLLWKPHTDLLSFINNPIDEKDLEKRFEFMSLEKFVAKEGARETSQQMVELVKKESVKSAKAAIMSRNMSHNLGSHVMAYLKNDLRNVPSIFASKVLHELYPNFFKPENSVTNGTNDIIDKVELPFLVGLGNFIGYLQERQDYIATIASSYIPSFSPVNFKDSVYDELNPDMRFERHHGSDPNNHNRPQNILLSYIAKSEKLSRLKSGDTNNHDIKLGYKYAGKIFGIDSNESDNEILAEMRHVNFALPGGIVGRQALFSIVENIIRNAAKHNNVQGDLHLIFEAIDGEKLKKNPNAFKDSISSACIRELYKSSKHIEDLIILTITDNQVCEEVTIKKLREALREPYIGPNAQLNKGIKEIRISSTWLRGVDDDDLFAPCPIDENESIPKNQMAPSVVIEKSKEGNLRYAICLRKTYEFALVYGKEDDESAKASFEKEFRLKEDSYKVVSEETIKDSDTCYEYIIAKDSTVFGNIRPHVTNRCINKDKIPYSVKASLKNGSSVFTPESIYQTYTGIDEKSPCIVIDDPKHPKQIIYKKKIKTKRDSKEKCYMYRSHHFAELDFGAYWVERWSRLFKGEVACIDAITGDNSSDRLVRREKLDKKWYIGHLYAMQSHVAIFDERLFQIIHGLDESQMTSGRYSTTEYSIMCQKGKWPEKSLNNRKLRDFAINVLHIPSNETLSINRFSELYSACISDIDKYKEISIKNRNMMTDFLEPFCFKLKDNVEGHRHLTAAYKEKGVDVYTIIPLGKKECIIVGCSPYKYKCTEVKIQQNGTKKKVPKPVYQFHFKPIAQIKFNEETKNFDVKIKAKKLFRYLSIHQGLIDKMYTEFGINDNDSKSKKDLLHKFYNAFMEEPDIENIDAFMPRMTIHSGRGHITEKDMPNQQPFLQYSAIEHAVLDCKYSLVELLDFAKYKKS